ncbi:hypothetical protein F3Y22_tig00111059pilonHSYRG00052 [Hibiscus syriacus]|uniref:Uncharacterized protein n=1 Tax=Hibiscus syriacus TaxID=106335 RepID=A0A6A2Z5V2_HIBSY|nr:hypothetical protein F3Y22_tig00111059pilonHSYRG00052 [Hibiscus syriacus]
MTAYSLQLQQLQIAYGKVLLMLGKEQFKLQKFVDSYRSHITKTITVPSESLLNELRVVEDYGELSFDYGQNDQDQNMIPASRTPWRKNNIIELALDTMENPERTIVILFHLEGKKEYQPIGPSFAENKSESSVTIQPLPAQKFCFIFSQVSPTAASDSKKSKQAVSGPVRSKQSPNKPVSVEHPRLFWANFENSNVSHARSISKNITKYFPTFVSTPKINELHELPRPPTTSASKSSTFRLGWLFSPLMPRVITTCAQTSGNRYQFRMSQDLASPPLTPISLSRIQPPSTNLETLIDSSQIRINIEDETNNLDADELVGSLQTFELSPGKVKKGKGNASKNLTFPHFGSLTRATNIKGMIGSRHMGLPRE